MARGQAAEPQPWSQFDSEALDARVVEINRWIDKAGEALQTFFIEDSGGFRRSTLGREDGSATSTCRSLHAMVDLRRVLLERGGEITELDKRLTIVADKWIVPLSEPSSLNELRERSGNGQNAFTDAQLLTIASLAPGLAPLLPDSKLASVVGRIPTSTRSLSYQLSQRLVAEGGGSIEPAEGGHSVHDFITMHAVRGVDARRDAFGLEQQAWDPSLADAIHERALGQLGFHSADVLSQYDPAELLFGVALLRRFGTANCEEVTRHAVEIIADSQTDDGAWPSSRIVSYEATRLLHVASYEVALTMATVAYRDVVTAGPSDEALLLAAVQCLEKSMHLVRSSYLEKDGYAGWANDRTRWHNLIEGWATAIVLLFLIRYRDVLLAIQQRKILHRYRASQPNPCALHWPELDWAMRLPGKPDTGPLQPTSYSDPTDGEIVRELTERVLGPVALHAAQQPSDSGAFLLLYGKPGTRKTSLIKRLADSLAWPVVTLSPPNFLSDGGLEGFEAAADRIFRDLMRLRRCVVLFDECEDFFKPRDSPRPDDGPIDERPESRTIGAFLTAGMLPRLQDLRDRRWVIFALATNSGLEDLDSAVIRPGRFDIAQEIDHPTLAAQLTYVKEYRQPLTAGQRRSLRAALRALAQASNDPMPFAVIDEVARELRAARLGEDPDSVLAALREGRDRVGPPRLLS
jgi:ATPase family associated with various cellular activities (AAA)